MAYATLTDVQALNQGRTTVFSATSHPSSTQVQEWLDDTAAEIDGILRGRGYALPVPTTATGALGILRRGNTLGTISAVESSAKQSDRRDLAYKVWTDWKKTLGTMGLELDDSKDPVVSTISTAVAPTQMFSRGMCW